MRIRRRTTGQKLRTLESAPLRKPVVLAIQLAVVAVVLFIWQNAAHIPIWGGKTPALDPFFISSPSRIYHVLADQLSGNGQLLSYLWTTVKSSLAAIGLGLVFGALAGLLVSESRPLAQVARPFLVAVNAIPRIALIPIIVTIFGPTFRASVVSGFLVVFFVVFFNAYEGGVSVSAPVRQNALLLGASRLDMMRTIRLPYVYAWTFASLPLAVTFGFVTVVTTEILTGYPGMGRFIVTALNTADASLTFAAVIVLGVVGLVIVLLSEATKKRVLHWWESNDRVGG